MRSRVNSSLGTFWLMFGWVCWVALATSVTPVFEQMYADMNLKLPLTTKAVLRFSSLIRSYYPLLWLGLVGYSLSPRRAWSLASVALIPFFTTGSIGYALLVLIHPLYCLCCAGCPLHALHGLI